MAEGVAHPSRRPTAATEEGRVSPGPLVTELPVADADAGPYGITTGAEGALSLTLVHRGTIVRPTARAGSRWNPEL